MASSTAFYHRTTDETGIARMAARTQRLRCVEQADNPGNYNYIGPNFVGPTFSAPPGMADTFNIPAPTPPPMPPPVLPQMPPSSPFQPYGFAYGAPMYFTGKSVEIWLKYNINAP